MNIRSVRDTLKKYHTLTLGELATATGESADELQFILTQWQHQFKIAVSVDESFCGGCSGCGSGCSTDEAPPLRYQWVA